MARINWAMDPNDHDSLRLWNDLVAVRERVGRFKEILNMSEHIDKERVMATLHPKVSSEEHARAINDRLEAIEGRLHALENVPPAQPPPIVHPPEKPLDLIDDKEQNKGKL